MTSKRGMVVSYSFNVLALYTNLSVFEGCTSAQGHSPLDAPIIPPASKPYHELIVFIMMLLNVSSEKGQDVGPSTRRQLSKIPKTERRKLTVFSAE